MVNATHKRFPAGDRSYFSILKKEIHAMAREGAMESARLHDLDIVVSELTSNLHKFGREGEILAGIISDGENEYMELICIDHGPGINDLTKAMADGYSTQSTMGMGLGSIKRLSDVFDIYTAKDWGTIVLSRIYLTPLKDKQLPASKLLVAAIIIPLAGEEKSGDGMYYKIIGNELKMLVADGLGHGKDAAQAVTEAIAAFKACPFNDPVEIIRHLHASVRKTRGLVATVVVYNFSNKTWQVAGVGNISSRFCNFLQTKNYIPHNGIIGHNIPNTMNNQVLNLADYNTLAMCSDGIKSRWELGKLPGINRCDLTIQAAAVYKDFSRHTDDTSVIITKINQR